MMDVVQKDAVLDALVKYYDAFVAQKISGEQFDEFFGKAVAKLREFKGVVVSKKPDKKYINDKNKALLVRLRDELGLSFADISGLIGFSLTTVGRVYNVELERLRKERVLDKLGVLSDDELDVLIKKVGGEGEVSDSDSARPGE